jgi:hypothetical protein
MFSSAYVLMTNKSDSSYKLVLQELKTAALTLGFELHPSIILADFELAAINAYKFHSFREHQYFVVFFILVND